MAPMGPLRGVRLSKTVKGFFLAITSTTSVALAQARKLFLSYQVCVLTYANRLIAIMIGRFRMTVLDCLEEYEKMGQKVFGYPRPLRALNTAGLVNRPKYKASKLRDVFTEVARKRSEHENETALAPTFASREAVCQT